MADRFPEDRFFGPEDQYQVGEVRTGRMPRHSSAREYAIAGYFEREPARRMPESSDDRADRGAGYRSAAPRERGYPDRESGYRGRESGYHDSDRGFFERAGDEVRSWFGDEDAERRRERDMRYDGQSMHGQPMHGHDRDYSAWRRERIGELDRDYDEYRRENAQRFHDEFSSWRTERRDQRDGLRRVEEHMEVVGSDGSHVGTVDKVRGDRIVLTRSDSDAGGHHHSIPSRWIASVGDKIALRKTADEAQAAWKDEERSGAFFGAGSDDSREWRGDHNLNRSFRGTY